MHRSDGKRARALMLVGTASHVGKSVLCTAFCRIFAQDGWRVAPFKAQNMSLNSAVTPSGREIGRAQAVQAEACGILPNEHMNPVLLKPSGGGRTQVVVQGKVYAHLEPGTWRTSPQDALWQAICESYAYLAARYDLIVIEGAGSPVEMNLKARDLANMRTAELADAAVLLVADIDRGGVFAAVVGTLQLLAPEERARVRGIVINRFRGDPAMFADGARWLEEHTGLPVVGVVPYLADLGIEEEDGQALPPASAAGWETTSRHAGGSVGRSAWASDLPGRGASARRTERARRVRVAVVQLPHISNFTDVDPLFLEPDVDVRFVVRPDDVLAADAVVLPGTKNTLDDLAWLHEQGLADAVRRAAARGAAVLGICGGFQMMGQLVRDPLGMESGQREVPGLGLLPCTTVIGPTKRSVLVAGRLGAAWGELWVTGYEIHMGRTAYTAPCAPFARLRSAAEDAAGEAPQATPSAAAGGVAPGDESPAARVTAAGEPAYDDGAVADGGRLTGTYIHGILHNDAFRAAWLNRLRARLGLPQRPPAVLVRQARVAAYDRLAAAIRQHVDMKQIDAWLRG